MTKFTLLIFILLNTFYIYCQNKLSDGLKTGIWIEYYDEENSLYSYCKGKYLITYLENYDTIRGYGFNCYEIKYKAATAILSYYGTKEHKIAVKDSIWEYYDSDSNLINKEYNIDGIIVEQMTYDKKGNLVEHYLADYENNISYYHYYFDNRLFKAETYPPNNKDVPTVLYYPNNNISLSNAELKFDINFIKSPIQSKEISIKVNENDVIDSIVSQNSFIHFNIVKDRPIQFPVVLEKNTNFKFNITADPSSTNYISKDTILIYTRNNTKPYTIYSYINATHISYNETPDFNFNTTETNYSFTLSRTKDKYLYLSKMSTSTDVLVKNNRINRHYKIGRNTKIDLTDLEVGVYKLMIMGCSASFSIELVLKE